MMKEKWSAVVFLSIILLAFVIGGGITGNVISQTCCTGIDCSDDNQCRTGEEKEVFVDYSFISILILLIASFVTYMAFHKHK